MSGEDQVLTALPPLRSAFIGREDVVGELLARRLDERLITIVGPGGMGKTRLALEFAHALADQRVRVGFVELADVRDDRVVVDVLADHLGVEVVPGATRYDGLMHMLAAAPTVLILDNFEHLVGAAADVSALVEECPELTVVVTSRRALHVAGEHLFDLSPLAATSSDPGRLGPGVELLLDRSHTDSPSPSDLDAAARIVDGVDGLPLAIELAALRVRSLGLEAVYELLVEDLALDGFRTEGEGVDRHSSLRRCLEWTYGDLDDGAQAVFRTIGAFAGTFDLRALRAVIDDRRRAATGLASLVEHSFVERIRADDGAVRYTCIAPIREFARELLASDPARDAIVDVHARCYASVAAAIRTQFECTDAEVAFAAFHRELPNINAAIVSRFAARRYAEAVAIACDVAKISVEAGREGRVNDWFREVVRRADAKGVEVCFEAQAWAAYGELITHRPATAAHAKVALEEVITRARTAGDDIGVLRGLDLLSYSVMAHGDLVRGLAACEEGAGLAAHLGLHWPQAQLSILRAMGLHVLGDIAEATRLGFEALRVARQLNALRLIVRVGLLFAPMERTPEMDAEQVPTLDACYAIARGRGSIRDEMYVVMQLAIRAGFSDRAEVFELVQRGFELAGRTGSHGSELVFTMALAGAAFSFGDDDVAETLDRALRLEWSALLPVMPRRGLDHYEQIVNERRAARGASNRAASESATSTLWSETLALAHSYASRRVEAQAPASAQQLFGLTDREYDVLREIAAGRTNNQIAAQLGIRPKTVMHHCEHIFRKLGVTRRGEAAAAIMQLGILDESAS